MPDCSQSEWAPMYQILCVLIATIGYGTATGHCQTPQAATTTITFQSATYGDMGQLLARQAAAGAVTVKATLGFPEQTRDHYPAVIVDSHTRRLSRRERRLCRGRIAQGRLRHIDLRQLCGARNHRHSPARITGLSNDRRCGRTRRAATSGRESRIDAKRVAIIGFSYGAEVAHLTAFEVLRSALNSGPDRFAAHVAFYPSGTFGAVAEPGAYTGSPVLMLLGDKDDNLPLTKIESYLAYARAAGAPAPIQTVIYPGAYHAWTVSDLTTARFFPDLVSLEKCPLILLGPKRSALLIDGEAKPFDPAAVGACLAAAPGYSMGFDAAVRAQSIADTISFLQRSLRQDTIGVFAALRRCASPCRLRVQAV